MADLVKIFYDVGKAYADEALYNYNQTHSKRIDKIVTIDMDKEYEAKVYDRDAIVDRFFLRVTSSNGGNLYPFLYLSEKSVDGIKKAFNNMRCFLEEEKKRELQKIEEQIDYERVQEAIAPYMNEKNCYVGLLYQGKTFNELFSQVATNYIQNVCKSDIEVDGDCYIVGLSRIGYDAKLNFCSVNELPAKLQKATKFRLLPLSQEAACLVKQGFEKIFEENIFRFSLFGLNYYLLPTLFMENKRLFFDKLQEVAQEDSATLKEKYILERKLERLVKKLEESDLAQKVLLSFLFAKKSNNAVDLYQMIEDVAPSRISKANQLMGEFQVQPKASRFVKKSEYDRKMLYIRDYIEDGLLLAKLVFAKEKITHPEVIDGIIAKKILFGSVANQEKRNFSLVVSGYFADDVDFSKHQRFVDFLAALGVLGFDGRNYIYVEEEMESFSNIAKKKFEEVELLRKLRARELYALGALTQLVMKWQYAQGSESLAKYLDSIGAVTMQNADRVFRKVYEGARKYGVGGKEYEDLLQLYVDAKEAVKNEDTISIDQANIAFVMGSVDYKKYKEQKGEE